MTTDYPLRLGVSLTVAALYFLAVRAQLRWISERGPSTADFAPVPGWRFRLPQLAALCLHAWSLGFVFLSSGGALSPLPLLSLALLLIVLMITIYGRWDSDAERLLLIVQPLAGLSAPMSMLIAQEGGAAGALGWDVETWLHAVLALIAFSLLAVAAAQGLALLILDRGLKRHEITSMVRYLPALQTQERIILRCLRLGAAMLLLAIASGFLFEENLPLYARVLFSLSALAACLIPLLAHRMFGWRGRRLVWWTLGGLALILLSYLAHLGF